MRPIIALFAGLLLIGLAADPAIANEHNLFWATGDRLLPALLMGAEISEPWPPGDDSLASPAKESL